MRSIHDGNPEQVQKIMGVGDIVFEQMIDQIRTLSDLLRGDVATPYRVDPKDPNAGRKFLEAYQEQVKAKAGIIRMMSECFRLAREIITYQPPEKKDVYEDKLNEAQNGAQALLDQARANLADAGMPT
jgi:hypothetical protein